MRIVIIGGGGIGYALAEAQLADAIERIIMAPGALDAAAFAGGRIELLLTATMWIGRLEIVAVLALLRWEVWRHARWRRSVRSGSAG